MPERVPAFMIDGADKRAAATLAPPQRRERMETPRELISRIVHGRSALNRAAISRMWIASSYGRRFCCSSVAARQVVAILVDAHGRAHQFESARRFRNHQPRREWYARRFTRDQRQRCHHVRRNTNALTALNVPFPNP